LAQFQKIVALTALKTKTVIKYTVQLYKEIQIGSVAKSYMRKSFLIFEEKRKYLTIYDEAVSHI